jgi:hypothetical protein
MDALKFIAGCLIVPVGLVAVSFLPWWVFAISLGLVLLWGLLSMLLDKTEPLEIIRNLAVLAGVLTTVYFVALTVAAWRAQG